MWHYYISVSNLKLWECEHKEILFLSQGMGLHCDHNNFNDYIYSETIGTYNPDTKF